MCSLEKRGRVYILTLTGEGEHRLSPTTISAVRSALATVRSQSSSSSALITTAESSSRFFSNGFDLKWAQSASSSSASADRLSSMVSLFRPLIADLISLPMPTIAAVNGHASAAGFMLAICHDYVAMRGDRGVLYMSELDIGLPFPPYFMAIMRSKISDPMSLRDVVLGSKKIKADDAAKRGIVDLVCDSAAETVEQAVRLGEELAGRGWDGHVYASIRKGMFLEICKAVGLPEEEEEERRKLFASKL